MVECMLFAKFSALAIQPFLFGDDDGDGDDDS